MSHFSTRFLCSLILGVLLLPSFVSAQQTAQSLSVTPPLFQLSIEPSGVWQSSVRVVNNNNYELTVYAEVVNFAPEGERGQGKFSPILKDSEVGNGRTLAEWITMNPGPFVIPPEQTKELSFFVEIPEDAVPGGHFAAILISTEPPKESGQLVKTSQVVTSLFFVRVAGDIDEVGAIREFTAARSFVETPEAQFKLRFENKGNVHLQPRGDILITNMWGKERGVIPINYKTHYGNVLPMSIRQFDLSWKGEPSLADIGRYKAIVTLSYGEDGIKNVTSTTYFWVLPLKATLITLTILITFIALITFAIRRYVRHMLMLAGIDPDVAKRTPRASRMTELDHDVRVASYKTITAPLRKGAGELRSKLLSVEDLRGRVRVLREFIVTYKLFFISAVVIVLCAGVLIFFLLDSVKDTRDYEVIINSGESEVVVNSEEIIRRKLQGDSSAPADTKAPYALVLINAADEPGTAAEVAVKLEEQSFVVTKLETGEGKPRERTVILYDAEFLKEAEELSKLLGGALLSSRPTETGVEAGITIMVGKDQVK